ncbi:DNA methylase [Pirellula sp. SH-Sr6A]|uniref:DNA methyltransferase n=1 Tax=Pirellula sp. SH-Sr6A TaxID=1632865 RepID=UPI00078E2713|nr:DNA methyltransferase [Pirellula sp. SH-Sr6A]AMV30862.1 DNA methylase [Pirellula sp. SH-Sr6A]
MPVFNDKEWEVHNGDCIPHMLDDMPPESIDFAVFSPPFPSLYAYTDSVSDIGNVDAMDNEARVHLSFFFRGLSRVLKPGRAAIVHVCQIPRMKRSGGVGLCDFRGINIRLGERAGLIYEYDWSVRKNPQAQAIRTRSRELQFAGLESDRSAQRGTLQDYLIKFRKPGENAVKINAKDQVSRNDWIKWAEGCWDDIHETDTLNTAAAKSEDDTKHICPLQLEVIRRCVLLFSNPDEVVFSPFTGIGSEGFVSVGGKSPKTKLSIRDPRRFYGCELKPEYYKQACKNITSAVKNRTPEHDQALLF